METVSKLLNVFKKHLDILYDNNLVIGGIHALKLHGLILHREAVDFDIVIYNPTKKQEDYLEQLINNLEAIDDNEGTEECYRSYKIEENGFCIDFLLEREKQNPNNLLSILYNKDMPIFVQSIKNIIDAKSSYFNGIEFREKDKDDCFKLKELNFNLTVDKKYTDLDKLENNFTFDDLPF